MTSLTTILAPLSGNNLIEWYSDLTSLWHETGPIPPEDPLTPKGMTQWIHFHNYSLWHHEDEARRTDVPDKHIADAKHAIDRHNQQRSDGIEKLDIWIDNVLHTAGIEPEEEVEFNSETPGSIIDRLSILSLKIYHMDEQIERSDLSKELNELCTLRANILREQRDDLAKALDKLFLDLRQVKKRHKVYRQFKMYNDPRFNPAIYKNK
ncbi:DUF4254 domain-containing protein [candidate division KSB1 bacterium]|nr:DUF4254 domain-containing protein [candidate division KSB1 bacterium]